MLDSLLKLYHSGAYVALVIVAVFYGLKYADEKLSWFQQGKRAAYFTAVVGGLAAIVPALIAGTSPNTGMIGTFLGAALALFAQHPTQPAPAGK